jgi:excisionase family DNA binding protein
MSTEIFRKELLRPDEVADIFRVTKRTVYNWCDEGVLDAKQIGGVVRITSVSVKTILKSSNK